MNETLERAVRALGDYYAIGGQAYHGRDGRPGRVQTNEDAVRAVLKAIREPSEEMIEAGARAGVDQIHHKANAWERCVDDERRPDWLNCSKFSWQAAIDTILNEGAAK